MSRAISVVFVPGHLAVNQEQAFEMLGLNDGRSELGKKKAFKKLRDAYKIPTLPGGVFPLKKLEAACNGD